MELKSTSDPVDRKQIRRDAKSVVYQSIVIVDDFKQELEKSSPTKKIERHYSEKVNKKKKA